MGRKNRPGWDVHPGRHDTGIVGKKGEKRSAPVSGNPFSCRFRVGRLVIDFFDRKGDRSQFFFGVP
jgi:hypothetical protein